MNDTDTTYRDKGRSVFLAAIMVFSVVAMSVTFTGAAAAVNGDVGIDNIDVNPSSANDDATYTINHSVTDDRQDIDYVSVDLTDASGDGIDTSGVTSSDVSVTNGTGVDISDGTLINNNDLLIIGVSPENGDYQLANNDYQVEIANDAINNPEPGTYDLTLGLHESDGNGDPVTPAETADKSTFTIDSGGLPGSPTDNTEDLNVAPSQAIQVANLSYATPGEVSNVNVSLTEGGSATASVSDADTVYVQLFNSSGDRVKAGQTAYTDDYVDVGFTGATDIQRIEIFTLVTEDATDGAEFDALVTTELNPSVTTDTVGTQQVETNPANLTLVRGNVEDRRAQEGVNGVNAQMYAPSDVDDAGDPLPGAVPIANDTTSTINNRDGEFRIELALNEEQENFKFTIEDPDNEFRIFPNTETINQGEDNDVVLRIQDRILPEDVEITQSAEVAFADGEDTITLTADVFDENGDRVTNRDVEVTHDGEDDSILFDGVRTDSVTRSLGDSGNFSVDVASDKIQEVTFTFEVQGTVSEDYENGTATKTFVLDGEGEIFGDVWTQEPDAGDDRRSLEGAQVWTFQKSLFTSNSIAAPTPTDDYWFYRVVDNETGEVLDVNKDYRVDNDGQDNAVELVTLNQLNDTDAGVGSGFAVETDGSASDVFVTPLEPGEYRIEYSLTAPNASDDRIGDETDAQENFQFSTNNVTVNNNLTFEAAQARTAGPGNAQHWDLTDDQGKYGLDNLYTAFQDGIDYTVVATATGFDTEFVDAEVKEDGNFYEDGGDENFALDPIPVTPDAVNITQVGLHPPLSETGGAPDVSQIEDFDNKTDAFFQSVPRDGTVDVFKVEAGVEQPDGDIEPLDTPVEVDFTDVVDGQFVGVLDGDNATALGSESVVVDPGQDGTATLLFETNNAENNQRTQKRATLQENTEVTDTSNVRFVGILPVERAGVSGIVRDSNDIPISDSVVWTEQIDLFEFTPDGGDLRISVTPDTSAQPGTQAYAEAVDEPTDEFEIELIEYNGTANAFDAVLANETVERQDLRGFTFDQATYPQLSANGPYNLLDTADDETASYTLEPIPTVNRTVDNFQEDTSYTLRGVKTNVPEQGVRSLDALFDVLPNEGETQNVIIPIDLSQFEDASFDVSDLAPVDKTIQQGDNLTVSANITNSGDIAGEKDVTLSVEDGSGDVTELDTKKVDLDAGNSTTVQFELTDVQLPAGDYTHTISTEDDSADGSLTVNNATDNGSPTLEDYRELGDDPNEMQIEGLRAAIDDFTNPDVDVGIGLLRDVIDEFTSTS